MTLDTEKHPLDVQVVAGEVVMTGPRVAIALTPEAATETARRLAAAGSRAQGAEREDPIVVIGGASNDL